jgi:hypothetical protein
MANGMSSVQNAKKRLNQGGLGQSEELAPQLVRAFGNGGPDQAAFSEISPKELRSDIPIVIISRSATTTRVNRQPLPKVRRASPTR